MERTNLELLEVEDGELLEVEDGELLEVENRVGLQLIRNTMEFERIQAKGKFLFAGERKFWVKGVTYGAFRPDADGNEYFDTDAIRRDFMQMARHGINTVRIPHTMPPRALLDEAERNGLRVMVGLSAEQYVGYLIDKDKQPPDIEALVRDKVRGVAGHPALLCYSIGNEVPAPLVRWIGHRKVERYIERIYHSIKAEDPLGLVTYVNYPTTEYLQLPFLDIVSFNVYLETRRQLADYLPRLQNIADERPLIMSELGLDSFRNSEQLQADTLDWQIRTSFEKGCAGVFVFSWTDEWYRGGGDVEDWAFGVTTRERKPKPALKAMAAAFDDAPLPRETSWPTMSVVVCSYNGAKTIRDTLKGLEKLDYPESCHEIIVIDDGSTDDTSEIAADYPVTLIRTENRGLSAARNLGLQHATGQIVVYIDDDAYPDPDWLKYIAHAFGNSDHAGIGGPNLSPPDDPFVAMCVSYSPGDPKHVLISDELADHIPGCNMAFQRTALLEIGGFDDQFRVAGDDVDICWRLQDHGQTLGFSPAAVVWHHHRKSIKAYWKQQRGYGKAEALLDAKWPDKYNVVGHMKSRGRIYGGGLVSLFRPRFRIYHGMWGAAPFQSVHERVPGVLNSLSLMPEWYLLVLTMLGLTLAGFFWQPLLLIGLPLFLASLAVCAWQAFEGARVAASKVGYLPKNDLIRFLALTTLLHFTQPLARLWGRIRWGLTLWRSTSDGGFTFPRAVQSAEWTEDWVEPELRLSAIDRALRDAKARFIHGDEFARWDFEVMGGILGSTRMLMAVEDHGSGTQYVRLRFRPRIRMGTWVALLIIFALAGLMFFQGNWLVAGFMVFIASILIGGTVNQCGKALAATLAAVETAKNGPTDRHVQFREN
ncbi:glycosyltransferase [Pseudomonadota bacterium]